jgi:crotonobetainyl-CoA:carnitine CoA-transferase CaiB-like acyl-CoA transferase
MSASAQLREADIAFGLMNNVDDLISHPSCARLLSRRRTEKSLALLHRRCSLERRRVFAQYRHLASMVRQYGPDLRSILQWDEL